MAEALAVPVVKLLKIMTPSYISTMSKSISNEEKMVLSKMLANDLSQFQEDIINEYDDVVPGEEGGEEGGEEDRQLARLEAKREQEKKKNIPKNVLMQRNLSGDFPDKFVVEAEKEERELAAERPNEANEEGPKNKKNSAKDERSSSDFFLEEQNKLKYVQDKIRLKEIVQTYSSEGKKEIVKEDEELTESKEVGSLLNRRRY